MCEIISTAKPQIDGGTVKGIAIMTKERSKALPDVPTALEQGLPNLEAYTWNAIFLPKWAAPEIVKKLHDATVDAVQSRALLVDGIHDCAIISQRSRPIRTTDHARQFYYGGRRAARRQIRSKSRARFPQPGPPAGERSWSRELRAELRYERLHRVHDWTLYADFLELEVDGKKVDYCPPV